MHNNSGRPLAGIQHALELLQGEAQGLAKLSGAVNERLRQWEQVLSSLKLGVSVEADLPEEFQPSADSGARGMETALMFTKHDGRWGLYEWWGEPGEPESFHYTPIAECSRDLRVAALELMPELLHKAHESLRREAEKLQAVLSQDEAVLSTISSWMSPPVKTSK